MLTIEIVYTNLEKQILLTLQVKKGSTVFEAIELSGILKYYPEINSPFLKDRLGIYGQSVSPGTELKDLDRIEIYRPLLRDPKEARREKAKSFLRQKKAKKK